MTGDNVTPQAFRCFTSDEALGLLAVATSMLVQKGDALFHAGDVSDGVFFLEKGRLAVLQGTGFNDRTQVVALLEPGSAVGEGGAVGKSLRTATVVAIEDALLYYLNSQGLESLGERNPLVFIKLVKRLLFVANLRLQKCSERLAHIL